MKLKFPLIAGLVIILILVIFQFSGNGTQMLWDISRQGTWMLPLVAIAALIDSINPCAFSILLLTIAFLFGIGQNRRGILKIGGAYILGIFVVYILIGLGILQVLHLFNTPHFMAIVGAAMLIAWGLLEVIGELFPAFPIKLRIPHVAHGKIAALMERASLPTAFLLGALVGVCEFPCTGGPYLMVLGLLHDTATYARGLAYLIMYNAIFVLPLVVILSIASNAVLLEKVRDWKKTNTYNMRLWAGIAMIALGIITLLL